MRASIRSKELLKALPSWEHGRLAPNLEFMRLDLGTNLCEAGQLQGWVYFSTDCVVSKEYVMRDGATAAVTLIGCEGVVADSLHMDASEAPAMLRVQSAGAAWRVRREIIRNGLDPGSMLRWCLLRHTEALLAQCGHTAACNRHHAVEQRLCCWLLMLCDRVASDDLRLTHQLLARMLGVRREGVTETMGALQRAGALRCTRGHIKLLARTRLEAGSCECYAALRDELARLLPWSRVLRGVSARFEDGQRSDRVAVRSHQRSCDDCMGPFASGARAASSLVVDEICLY